MIVEVQLWAFIFVEIHWQDAYTDRCFGVMYLSFTFHLKINLALDSTHIWFSQTLFIIALSLMNWFYQQMLESIGSWF